MQKRHEERYFCKFGKLKFVIKAEETTTVETLKRLVIQRIQTLKGWNCITPDELTIYYESRGSNWLLASADELGDYITQGELLIINPSKEVTELIGFDPLERITGWSPNEDPH